MGAHRRHDRAVGVVAGRSSEEWARRLRRGEADAVRQVRMRVEKILAFKRLKIPKHDRDDLGQEIMTEIWQAVNRRGFDFTAGFWGFIEVVTSRRCIDWIRSRKEHARMVGDVRDRNPDPLEKTLRKERSEIANELLAELGDDCRRLILWRLRDGRSYSEIASAVNKTEGALRVQLYRCIRTAQRLLGQRGVPGSIELGGGRPS